MYFCVRETQLYDDGFGQEFEIFKYLICIYIFIYSYM